MHKIGIRIDTQNSLLVIETPAELQFELRDTEDKLLITGNKLRQPYINVSIKRLAKGSYKLILTIEGEKVFKTIEL